MPRGIRKAKPIAENQVETLRQAGVREEVISERMKEVGLSESQRESLGLQVPKPKTKRQEDIEPEVDFLKDVSSFLEYAHRELVPVRSKYPDAIANLMAWHRKLERRIDAIKAAA